MAEVVAPGQNTPQRQHGKKRAADNSLDGEQRLSKRFDLLNIDNPNGTRLYLPVAGPSDNTANHAQQHANPIPMPDAPATRKKSESKPRPADDHMQVEDTPHRLYIHDLSAELSDIESDEESPIFLSDIEKHLAKIRKHILLGPRPRAPEPTAENQMVLYNVPSSLTVPEAQDSVRKAIVEARARVRERQANTVVDKQRISAVPETAMSVDADAMDID